MHALLKCTGSPRHITFHIHCLEQYQVVFWELLAENNITLELLQRVWGSPCGIRAWAVLGSKLLSSSQAFLPQQGLVEHSQPCLTNVLFWAHRTFSQHHQKAPAYGAFIHQQIRGCQWWQPWMVLYTKIWVSCLDELIKLAHAPHRQSDIGYFAMWLDRNKGQLSIYLSKNTCKCIDRLFFPAIEPFQKAALVFLCTTLWQSTAKAGLEGKAAMEKGS